MNMASKAAQKKAAELGVDLSEVAGTGKGGNVLVADVVAHAERAGERPFTVGVVTKFWGRPSVAELMQRHIQHVASVVGVGLVCVGARSPGDPHPAPEVEGWEYVEAPNMPLSDKGNAAAVRLKGRCDALLNMGSDDLVSPGYLRAAIAALQECDYVEPDSLVYHDLSTGKTVAVVANRVGAGRLFSAALMDRMDWEPWAPGQLPDVDADRKLAAHGAKRTQLSGRDIEGGSVMLDLKDGHSIGSFSGVTRSRLKSGAGAYVDTDEVLAACGVSEALWEGVLVGYHREQVPVRMRALVNIPGGMIGMPAASRVERGDFFEAKPRVVHTLRKHRYAEVV